MMTPDGRLVLLGVTHRLEVTPAEGGSFELRAWSPSVLTGEEAVIALDHAEATELTMFLEVKGG